jgi:hypothetical protein
VVMLILASCCCCSGGEDGSDIIEGIDRFFSNCTVQNSPFGAVCVPNQ